MVKLKGSSAGCWCDSKKLAEQCCLPILAGRLPATTAEALMRSRYSAYVGLDTPYLLSSWHPDTRPPRLELDAQQRWLGLKIRRLQLGGESDETGVVEFVARYKIDGRGFALREVSEFCRWQGRWVYLAGLVQG